MNKFVCLLLTFILFSCGQRVTTDDDIYSLLEFVMKDQALDKTHGLNIVPEENCDLSKSDKEFLTDLIEIPSTTDSLIDSTNLELLLVTKFEYGLSKCLTKEDVQYMLNQKIENSDLKWDNARLGFDSTNKKNWYVFSVPLFSKDRSKAVMMVRDLCTGLCGRGWTLLLKKENGKWTSERGASWLH